MELIVLGCDGSYPSANGACSGYLVREGRQALLLDCGSGVLGKLMAMMDPAELSAVVITHWHADHASDLLTLRYYLEIVGAQLPVYAPEVPSLLREACACPALPYHSLEDGFAADPFSVSAMPVQHPVPTYAVRVASGDKAIVYTGDTASVDGLLAFCAGADILVCDAAFPAAAWQADRPHISAEMAAQLARDSGVGKLVLTHCPPHQDAFTLEREAQAVFADSQSAKPGLKIRA